MFNFFKKNKIGPLELAAYIAREPSKYDLEKSTDEFIKRSPEFSVLKNKIIDEVQWIIVSTGVAATRCIGGVDFSGEVRKQLIYIYSSATKGTDKAKALSPEDIRVIENRLDSYVTRFNRGLVFRTEGTSASAQTLHEAIKDMANESMKYITGTSRCTEVSWENAVQLQERTVEEDALEKYILKISSLSFQEFYKYFSSLKITV